MTVAAVCFVVGSLFVPETKNVDISADQSTSAAYQASQQVAPAPK